MAFYRHNQDIEAFQLIPGVKIPNVTYLSKEKMFRYCSTNGCTGLGEEGDYIVKNPKSNRYTYWKKEKFERTFRKVDYPEGLERP